MPQNKESGNNKQNTNTYDNTDELGTSFTLLISLFCAVYQVHKNYNAY